MISARPLAETLATVPFFSGLDAASLDRVTRGMRTRRFRRGEVIFHLGDPGDALFIVVSGAIKIMLPSDTGDEAILATLRAGDVFGELALLDGAPRSATAVAQEASETAILPRAQFRELLATEPAIRDALLASLAAELRRLTNHVEELHFLDITGRLASRLARLANESGRTKNVTRGPGYIRQLSSSDVGPSTAWQPPAVASRLCPRMAASPSTVEPWPSRINTVSAWSSSVWAVTRACPPSSVAASASRA